MGLLEKIQYAFPWNFYGISGDTGMRPPIKLDGYDKENADQATLMVRL
jgi:hypothetical protein